MKERELVHRGYRTKREEIPNKDFRDEGLLPPGLHDYAEPV